MKKLLVLLALATPIFTEARITSCTCFDSIWTDRGWIDIEYHYATNNGSCFPNGTNTYNFGSASVYLDGEYIGTRYYKNINDFLTCINWI